jgi:hypothetical protein
MRIRPTLALLALACVAPLAQAEIIMIDGQVQMRDAAVPTPGRGMSMRDVEAKFGVPASRTDAVGVPPITRWDYPSFSVYFERDRVIHAVVHGG